MMHHAKNRGNKEIPYSLSNTIKDTSTIMRDPLPELCREGLCMIVVVSLIVLLRGFSHGACHPYIPIHSIEGFLHLFNILLLYGSHTNAAIYVHGLMRSYTG